MGDLSPFRKKPDPDDLSSDDIWTIAVHGVADFLRSAEVHDWDMIAEKAVNMFLAGYDTPDICQMMGLDVDNFEAKIDVRGIKAFIEGEIAKGIYQDALEGDQKAQLFVAETKMGWAKKKEVSHKGKVDVNLRPVLNIAMLSKSDEKKMAKERAIEVDYEPNE